jgi:hypothetical protein
MKRIIQLIKPQKTPSQGRGFRWCGESHRAELHHAAHAAHTTHVAHACTTT